MPATFAPVWRKVAIEGDQGGREGKEKERTVARQVSQQHLYLSSAGLKPIPPIGGSAIDGGDIVVWRFLWFLFREAKGGLELSFCPSSEASKASSKMACVRPDLPQGASRQGRSRSDARKARVPQYVTFGLLIFGHRR